MDGYPLLVEGNWQVARFKPDTNTPKSEVPLSYPLQWWG